MDRLRADMERQMGQVQAQVAEVVNSLASMAQARQAGPQPQPQLVNDQEIRQAAEQGHFAAQEYLTRQAARAEATAAVQSGLAQQQRATQITQQIQLLMAKYPQFKEAGNPLSATTASVRNTLLQQGYPNDLSTILEAMKVAIVDNPEVVAQMVNKGPVTNELARQSAVASQSMGSMRTGAARRSPAEPETPKLEKRALDMAKRMGVKDPTGSVKRMYERNAGGKSALSPTVAMVIREG
jgi:hypothetical protein